MYKENFICLIKKNKKIIIDFHFFNVKFQRNLNIYTAVIPERLHHCDIGLFQYQLQYTFELLKELNTDFIRLMNERFKEIPRFTEENLEDFQVYFIL